MLLIDRPKIYRCRLCGKPKKGHICTGIQERRKSIRQVIEISKLDQHTVLERKAVENLSGAHDWLVTPLENAVEEAVMFNARLLAQRRRRPAIYWEQNTASLQCTSSFVLHRPLKKNEQEKEQEKEENEDELALKAIQMEHWQMERLRQEHARYVAVVRASYARFERKKTSPALGPIPIEASIAEPLGKPVSAFVAYCQLRFRDAVEALLRDVGALQLTEEAASVRLAQMWAGESDETRHHFEVAAARHRREWLDAMQAYNAASSVGHARATPAIGELLSKPHAGYAAPEPFAYPTAMAKLHAKREKRKRDESPHCVECGRPERANQQLFTCAGCYRSYHPTTCLVMYADTVERVLAQPAGGWRCADCTICEICADPGYDSSVLLCDSCDRGFHTFCLDPPLHAPPDGAWHCEQCRRGGHHLESLRREEEAKQQREASLLATHANNTQASEQEKGEGEEQEAEEQDTRKRQRVE
jgi:PHD-finger